MKLTETEVDILVVGAGSAGVAAAVAAAQEGKKVALLEKNSFPGGRATASAVGTVCGLYLRSEKEKAKYVADGFMRSFAEKLQHYSNKQPEAGINGLYYLPYHPFDFKNLCDELLSEAGVQPYYHATVFNVETNADKITTVDAFVYDRKLRFSANAVIDCSGEATVCFLAGDNTVEEKEYQASAQVFTIENIETDSPETLGFHVAREVKRAVNEGILHHSLQYVSVVPGSFNNKGILLKIGIPLVIGNQENKATEVELTARKNMKAVFEFLKRKVEVFKNSHISFVATEAGIRTGRRASGNTHSLRMMY